MNRTQIKRTSNSFELDMLNTSNSLEPRFVYQNWTSNPFEPLHKLKLWTFSARNWPNPCQNPEKLNLEPFWTQVHPPKPKYEPYKNPDLRTYELGSTQHYSNNTPFLPTRTEKFIKYLAVDGLIRVKVRIFYWLIGCKMESYLANNKNIWPS